MKRIITYYAFSKIFQLINSLLFVFFLGLEGGVNMVIKGSFTFIFIIIFGFLLVKIIRWVKRKRFKILISFAGLLKSQGKYRKIIEIIAVIIVFCLFILLNAFVSFVDYIVGIPSLFLGIAIFLSIYGESAALRSLRKTKHSIKRIFFSISLASAFIPYLIFKENNGLAGSLIFVIQTIFAIVAANAIKYNEKEEEKMGK